jgi:glucose/arabinose dehydrogenase
MDTDILANTVVIGIMKAAADLLRRDFPRRSSQIRGTHSQENQKSFSNSWADRSVLLFCGPFQRAKATSRCCWSVLLFSGVIFGPLSTVPGQPSRASTQAIGYDSFNAAIQSRGSTKTVSPASLPTAEASTSVIRINCGGPDYIDNGGHHWSADMNYLNGMTHDYGTAIISGANDPTIYQTERYAATLRYAVPLPNGSYTVTLYFAEMYFTGAGQRVFDVTLEGQTVLQDFDIFAIAGAATAVRRTFTVTVNDGMLDIVGAASVNNATFSAIKIVPSSTTPSPSDVLINCGGASYIDSGGQSWSADQYFVGGKTKSYSPAQPVSGTADPELFQTERYGKTLTYQIPVANGNYEVTIDFAEMFWNAAGKRVFDVTIQGQTVLQDFDIWALAGQYAAVQRTFVVAVTDGILDIEANAAVDNAQFAAIQVVYKAGDLYLHPIATIPSYVVDYNGTGSALVPLVGDESHTHQSGHNLTSWTWTEGAKLLGTAADINVPLSLGQHTVQLTIGDDNTPPRTASTTATVTVTPVSIVPGALTSYYQSDDIPLGTLIDSLPASPGYMEVLPSLQINNIAGNIGDSSFTSNVVAVMDWNLKVATAASYQFTLNGSGPTRMFVDGALITGTIFLKSSTHSMQARFAIPSSSTLPAQVLVSIDDGPAGPVNPADVTHDESDLKPFINDMPSSGSPLGGDFIIIDGIGFFPAGSVTVRWGNTTISESSLSVTPTSIQFKSPAGNGTIKVSVRTPNGVSNSINYQYVQGVVPINFTTPTTIAALTAPTAAVWGPDGRLYVGSDQGNITIYAFDDNYQVTDTQVTSAIAALDNKTILGMTVNPRDPPDPVKIYVAHSELYAEGGGEFMGPAPYNGQVSVLTGPSFSKIKPLITGLPVSGRDHAINGMTFDDAGNLLIAVGSATNAGVPSLPMGTLPNSPLDAAILKAPIFKANFNGAIAYIETATGKPNNDQVFGDRVDVAPGVDVSVFASGMRNPFDIVWTTRGKLYGTDNGMNANFGAISTGPNTQATESNQPDKINYLVEGNYYGSPNRNRGRYDARQNVYHYPTEPTTSVFTGPLARVLSSTDGIDEYRATAFKSEMRGDLIVQHWKASLSRAALASDGLSVKNVSTLASTLGLTSITGPGGAILSMDYSHDKTVVITPIDSAVTGMTAYDIFPWRGRADGKVPFVIGGVGFGALSGTTVTIGGIPAVLTSVSSTRIRGLIPANAAPGSQLLDVVVKFGGQTSTITQAFRYN